MVMFAGPNGSGKSSVTPIFSSQTDFPKNYINPDEIALTLGGNTIEKAYEASAIAARERLRCIEQKESFAFETVMSHPSKLAILETARRAGFQTRVIFVCTDNPQTNVNRVKQRVVEGGHDVPENKVVSRYHRSLSLLPRATEVCDRAYLVDNSDSLEIKAVLSQGQVIEKPGAKIAWVENTLATLYGRQQEKITIQQQYPSNSVVFLDRGQHEGEIKFYGDHFLVQQTTDRQTVIHDNSILKLAPSIVGDRIKIAYQNGVHDLTNYTQQQRVERIAPILLDYLQLHQKQFVENDNSIVKFDRETKTIFYRSKSDNNERLKAQYQDGRWLDLTSSISQDKESYFVNEIAPKIKAQLVQKRENNNQHRTL